MDEQYQIKTAIEAITVYEKNKNDEQYSFIGKDGKKQTFLKVNMIVDINAIDDRDFEGKISFLDFNRVSDNWDVGTELEGIVIKKESGGNIYWNFKLPRKTDLVAIKVDELEKRVEALEKIVAG